MAPADAYTPFDAPIAARPATTPWLTAIDGSRRFVPDYELLADLLAIPVRSGHAQATGRFAKAIDAWCAHELRRAGFFADEVWPRSTQPRILPRDVALLVERLPVALRDAVSHQVLRNKKVAPAEAHVLGRVFVKQADVLVAQWSRGVEVLISTKSMLSSYGNNLRNRFEESYGDAKNLRGRFPLAALGFVYLLRSTVFDEPASWELALDILRKLREEADVYDATGLLVASWDDANFNRVTIDNERVPRDLRVDQLFEAIITRTLERTPVQFHVHLRELRDQVELQVEEELQPGKTGED